ncbi:MAG: DUF4290 domain-containing protein [Bacteroidota bacterium]
MQYNSARSTLVMKEYGRNVQKLIDLAIAETDKEKRNRMVQSIIDVMGQLNPHLRNTEDYKHKLWDHLFLMSDFKLEADSPYPIPEREALMRKPDPLPYPQERIKHKSYGKNLMRLVSKAVEEENPERKELMLKVIGNYIKVVHTNWIKENVSDENVKVEINTISDGKLSLSDDMQLSKIFVQRTNTNQNRNNNQNYNRNNNNRNGGNRNNGGGNNNRRHHNNNNRNNNNNNGNAK